jgi:cytochrome d ubiquinol oxidase subunit I
MQHPVGYKYDAKTGRAELHDFWAVMFNKVQLVTFPHVVLSAYMTAGAFVLGVAAYLYLKERRTLAEAGIETDSPLYLKAVRIGAAVTLVAGLGVAISGDVQGKIMTDVQPMKMAAAEGLYDTESSAPFSLLTIGTPDGKEEKFAIKVPDLLSFLAEGDFNAEVKGINQLRNEYQAKYGQDPGAKYYSPGDYTPIIPVTYWSFRFMIGLGVFAAAGAALILLVTRKGGRPLGVWWPRLAILLPIAMILGNAWGWMFTEMGRQPWVVFGLMTTAQGVSPGVSVFEAWVSVIALTSIYAVLAVVEFGLMWRYIKLGAPAFEQPPDHTSDEDRPLAFAY